MRSASAAITSTSAPAPLVVPAVAAKPSAPVSNKAMSNDEDSGPDDEGEEE